MKYLEERFENHVVFLDRVRSIQIQLSKPSQRVLFRGVGNADYSLLPSAFRKSGEEALRAALRLEPGHSLDPNKITVNHTHVLAELVTISLFYRFANQQGISLPTLSN
ncbi:MAG: hypothetical protein AAGD92_01285 [Pseudomonadota bacterium]